MYGKNTNWGVFEFFQVTSEEFRGCFEDALGPFWERFGDLSGTFGGRFGLVHVSLDTVFFPRWRHTIRNCIFRYQSLQICYFCATIKDSRHFQLAIYTVFHAESESAVRIEQILHPEEKIKETRPYTNYRFTSFCSFLFCLLCFLMFLFGRWT